MIDQNYDPNKEGSALHIGDKDSETQIVVLHGNGRFAEDFKSVAEWFTETIPSAHIIIPNGTYKIPNTQIPLEYREELERTNKSAFTWFDFSQSKNALAAFTGVNKNRERDVLDDCIDDLSKDSNNRIYLFGFSMGGIRAAGDFAKASNDAIKGAVLHSSAITSLGEIISKPQDKKAPARIFTVMGKDDNIMPSYIMKPLAAVHYYNQLKLRFNGVTARSQFLDGLGHNISAQSAEICANHIKKLDEYFVHNHP
ncbi:MAG: hypothetical protein CL561_02265 [Alphaproteobacteria bacterium]|mgnify:CR=1 FL=1|nr:hypothetical protein [Alphaproteobacteria bacterium]|tara:strand:+ start:1452 stop:2213 length:762 start_codon:yes stop_codon:yes gene_type:complete